MIPKPVLLGGMAVGALVALLLVYWSLEHSVPESTERPTLTGERQLDGVKPLPHSGAVPGPLNERPIVPPELAAFPAAAPDAKLHMITELQGNSEVSPAVIKYLRLQMHDRRLEAVTRNNIANVLIGQHEKDPYLHREFIAMIDDVTEDEQWREYSVQHLARTLPFTAEPTLVVRRLFELMRGGERGIPGTALLHLHRAEENGLLKLPDGYIPELLAMARSDATPAMTRLTAVSVLAERAETRALPLIRDLASRGTPALRRIAIAALGPLGEANDVTILRQAAEEPPGSGIRESAIAALRTFTERFSDPPSSPSQPF